MSYSTLDSFKNIRYSRNPSVAAAQMLRALWNGVLPVDVESLAAESGLEVVERHPHDDDEPFPYSGRFRRDRALIEVNGEDAPVRKRFTLAHELGHFAMAHPDALRDYPAVFSTTATDPIERAANHFAASLLMPAEALKKIFQSGEAKDVDQLADMFGVSKVAMTYRLLNLGLI